MKTLFNKFAVGLLGAILLVTLSFASYGRVSYDSKSLSKISVEKSYILLVADASVAKSALTLQKDLSPLFDVPVTHEYSFSGTVMYISKNDAKYDNTYINGILNERRRQKSSTVILT